jgi:hypothetical protein
MIDATLPCVAQPACWAILRLAHRRRPGHLLVQGAALRGHGFKVCRFFTRAAVVDDVGTVRPSQVMERQGVSPRVLSRLRFHGNRQHRALAGQAAPRGWRIAPQAAGDAPARAGAPRQGAAPDRASTGLLRRLAGLGVGPVRPIRPGRAEGNEIPRCNTYLPHPDVLCFESSTQRPSRSRTIRSASL